jgi:hypothetical protein
MKKIFLILAVAVFLWGSSARADYATGIVTFTPHTIISSTDVNSNFSTLASTINGLLDYVNLKNLGITGAKLANSTITAGKMACSGYWATLTGCASTPLNADADHVHSAGAITVADSGGHYATNTVESALAEIAVFTGYDSSASGTTSALRYMGFATGSATVTVATGTAPNGVIITLSGFIQSEAAAPNTCVTNQTVKVNGTNLSTALSPQRRFTMSLGVSSGSLSGMSSNTFIYTPSDGWPITGPVTITVGDVYNDVGSTCSASASSSESIVVQGIQ